MFVASFPSFREASAFAKKGAIQQQRDMDLIRYETVWFVFRRSTLASDEDGGAEPDAAPTPDAKAAEQNCPEEYALAVGRSRGNLPRFIRRQAVSLSPAPRSLAPK